MRRSFWKPGNRKPVEAESSALPPVEHEDDGSGGASGAQSREPLELSGKLSAMKFMARVSHEEARASAHAEEQQRSAAAAWSFEVPTAAVPPTGSQAGLVCVPDTDSTLAVVGRPGWTVGAAGRHSFKRFNASLDTTKAAAAVAQGLQDAPSAPEGQDAEGVDEDEMLEAFMAMRQPGGGAPAAKRRAAPRQEHQGAGGRNTEHTGAKKRPKKAKKGTKRPRE